MTEQKFTAITANNPPFRPSIKKPLRFYATAAFNDKYLLLVANFAAVVSAHFRERPMDLYVFENGPKGTIKVRVNGHEFGRHQTRDVSFNLPPFPGPRIDPFWCKIDEQEDEYAAMFLYPSEY